MATNDGDNPGYVGGQNCDICKTFNFGVRRYKCLICYDCCMCGSCYDKGIARPPHSVDHSMQFVIPVGQEHVYFGGDAGGKWESYACPVCPALGMTTIELVDHWTNVHDSPKRSVVCPICVCMQLGGALIVMDLSAHLSSDHMGDVGAESRSNIRPDPILTRNAVRRGGLISVVRGGAAPRGGNRGLTIPPPSVVRRVVIRADSPPTYSADSSGDDLAAGVSGINYDSLREAEEHFQRQVAEARQKISAGLSTNQLESATTSTGELGDVHWNPVRDVEQEDVEPVVEQPEQTHEELLPNLFAQKTLTEEEQVAAETERANRALFVEELFYSNLLESCNMPK